MVAHVGAEVEVPHGPEHEVEQRDRGEGGDQGPVHALHGALLELVVQRGDVVVHAEAHGEERDGTAEVGGDGGDADTLGDGGGDEGALGVCAGNVTNRHRDPGVEDGAEGDDGAEFKLRDVFGAGEDEEKGGGADDPETGVGVEPGEAHPGCGERLHGVPDDHDVHHGTPKGVEQDGTLGDDAHETELGGFAVGDDLRWGVGRVRQRVGLSSLEGIAAETHVGELLGVLREANQKAHRGEAKEASVQQEQNSGYQGGKVERDGEGKDTTSDDVAQYGDNRRRDCTVALVVHRNLDDFRFRGLGDVAVLNDTTSVIVLDLCSVRIVFRHGLSSTKEELKSIYDTLRTS